LIGRLSTIITALKSFLYTRTALRTACYLLIVLALLLYWLYTDSAEISFIYNNF
jgi:hypothetical protein